VLGHFGGRGLLGSSFHLDANRSKVAIKKLATEISDASGRRCSKIAAAEGVIAVANTNMERALRHISVERGYDPRQFALLPFGGAGGLHAVALARALRVPLVIVPRAGGALSAIGVLAADVVKDQTKTVMLTCDGTHKKKLEQTFREMEREGRQVLEREGFSRSRQRHERSLGMRYLGQSFELEVNGTSGDIGAAFHRAHLERYGYAQEESEIQIVSARVRSTGMVVELHESKLARGRRVKPADMALTYLDGKRQRVAVYVRDDLRAGSSLKTPCIVTEYSATTLIPTGVKATVDSYGNLLLSL
jgi:N-methylhydantoinase A